MSYTNANVSMKKLNRVGHKSLIWVQDIGLLIIAVSTVVAVGIEIGVMIDNMTVTLADLLLLFIYLEVLAMVAIYLDSGKLPVRMPLYISIVALARYLILDMKEMETWRVIGVAAAALLLAVTVLIIRYGHIRYPYEHLEEDRQ
jgi:protein PsiE